jgi:hypothetical protein
MQRALGLPTAWGFARPLDLLGDERDLSTPASRQIHHLHHLGVRQARVGLEEDDLVSLVDVLQALLSSGRSGGSST